MMSLSVFVDMMIDLMTATKIETTTSIISTILSQMIANDNKILTILASQSIHRMDFFVVNNCYLFHHNLIYFLYYDYMMQFEIFFASFPNCFRFLFRFLFPDPFVRDSFRCNLRTIFVTCHLFCYLKLIYYTAFQKSSTKQTVSVLSHSYFCR